MTEDLEWARDLFDRTRGAGEPAWTADAMELARCGDRRRRLRTAGAGGGLAGVVAVTAAVALGLGAGTTDLGSQPGPGGGWGNRPLADVFEHVSYFGPADGSGATSVPAPAVTDLAVVLGRLDPSLSHLTGSTRGVRVVSPHDWQLKQATEQATEQATAMGTEMGMGSVWTTDAPRPSGQLSFRFDSSVGFANIVQMSEPGADQLTGVCAFAVGDGQPQNASGATPLSVRWSACTQSHLADGSTIGSASVRIGEGTAIVVVRQFADGEVFSVVAQDFWTSGWQGSPPDPTTVVHPTPWSEQSLAAALADPVVRSGWHPIPPPNSDGRLLRPADLGNGWSYDTSEADDNSAAQYFIANGCAADRYVPLAKPGSAARYWGQLPNGISGTAYEGEYRLRSGTGAQTMAQARAAVQGGCKGENASVDSTKDTVVALPAGIGDEAFEEVVPGLGTVGVDVRVGDTILRTDVSNTNHVRGATWGDKKPLDLSSPADQQWLADLARAMVARYRASMANH